MAKVLVTAQVQDGAKWEAGLRTHAGLFKTYGLRGPVQFTVSGNDMALCVEPADAKAFLPTVSEPRTVEAMNADAVKRETLQVFVLDKEFRA